MGYEGGRGSKARDWSRAKPGRPQEGTHLPTSPGNVCKDTSFRARWARLRSCVKPSGSLHRRKRGLRLQARASGPATPHARPHCGHHPPGQGVPAEVCNLQGLAKLDALRNLRDVCDKWGHYGAMPVASRSSKPFLPPPGSTRDPPRAPHRSGTRPAPPAA